MVLQTERYNPFNDGYQQQSYSSYQGPNGGYSNYHGVTEHSSPYAGSFLVPTYPSTHGGNHQSGWSSGGDYYGTGANNYFGGGVVAPVKPATNGYSNSYYESSQTYPHSNMHGSPTHYGHGSPNHHGHGSSHGHGHDYGSPNHHGHGSGPHDYGKSQGFGGVISNQINKLAHGHNNHGSGSPNNHGHGSPQGHGSPYGPGKTHGFGGAISNQINKLAHGHNNYGNGSPNFGPSPTGFNHGYNQHHHQQHHQPSWTVKGLSDDDE